MADMERFGAILFPSDGRAPSIVNLMTSPSTYSPANVGPHEDSATRIPHPEVFMDYIAEKLGLRAWKYQVIECLDGMTRRFDKPYVIYYPVISRDGMSFPINKCIRDIQGSLFREETAWRGNIVVAKFIGTSPFSGFVDASIADYPIVKNFFMTHGCPPDTSSSSSFVDTVTSATMTTSFPLLQ